MIVEGQVISCRNVVSKLYTFYADEIELAIADLSNLLLERNLTPSGPMFYSIISDFREEPLTAEFFVPVEENSLPDLFDDEVDFRSYFSVDSLLLTRIDSDFETLSVEKHFELIDYTIENNMEISSPFFILTRVVDEKAYVEIYLGAMKLT